MLAFKLRESIRVATVTTKPGHRGEHEGNRKAIAQGMPVETGEPVEDYPHFVRPRVHRTPGIPCALLLMGRSDLQTSDASRRENEDSRSVVPAFAGTTE